MSFLFISCAVRCTGYKRLFHKHIQSIDADIRGMRFQAVAEPFPFRLREKVKNAAAEYDVIFRVGAIVKKIRLKNFTSTLLYAANFFAFSIPCSEISNAVT